VRGWDTIKQSIFFSVETIPRENIIYLFEKTAVFIFITGL
jgi:hypothetical protein